MTEPTVSEEDVDIQMTDSVTQEYVELEAQDVVLLTAANGVKLRTVDEAIEWGQGQIDNPTQSWKGLCQSFVRSAMHAPAWSTTAYDAWLRIPEKHRNTGPIEEAPRGAAIYFKRNHVGAERPGHVVLATKTGCMSNDILRPGMIDRAPRDIFIKKWNMVYLGWSTWTPFGEMQS